MFHDRRIYPRRMAMLSFKVHFGEAELSCVTTDISATGAFFAARNSPPVGTQLEIAVRPTGLKIPPVLVVAEVVRVNEIGGGRQPGFAVRFLSAHSDAGGQPVYHVLRTVLRVPGIAPEHLPRVGAVTFLFPESGEPIELESAMSSRASSAGSGSRLTGRPENPIQDAMPRQRRGSRVRPPEQLSRESTGEPVNPTIGAAQRPKERRFSTSDKPAFAAKAPSTPAAGSPTPPSVQPPPHRRGSATRPNPATITAQTPTAARRMSAVQSNPFTVARPSQAALDSGVFQPPSASAARSSAMPVFAVKPQVAIAGEPEVDLDAVDERTPVSTESSFDLRQPEESRVFAGKKPETSRIISPFSQPTSQSNRRKSTASSWSSYESGGQPRTSGRRNSQVIVQDDPFATGARKVAAKYHKLEEQAREKRRQEREVEREKMRVASNGRRRDSGGLSTAFNAESGEQEHSMIFARGGQNSTIGGPILTGVSSSPALPENATVEVQLPVTYELDGRFVPGTVVTAAPLALQIHTLDVVPQLDQRLMVNFPVQVEGSWVTIFLNGKLLRVPDRRDSGQVFVLHIERVSEGQNKGAYNNFLVAAHAESA